MLRAQERLGVHLIRAVAGKSPGSNIVVSPMGAAAALSIVSAGASDRFVRSVRHVLQMRAGGDARAALGRQLAQIAAMERAGSELAAAGGAASPLTVANRLVLDPSLDPNPAVLARLRELEIEASAEDLADPAKIAAINAWVQRKTGGLIASIIDEPPGKGGLIALNALYFKDRWRSLFDPERTRPLPFQSLDGKSDAVAMMAQEGTLQFRRDSRLVGVDLPFADPRYGLVVVTTRDKGETAETLAHEAGPAAASPSQRWRPRAATTAGPRCARSGSTRRRTLWRDSPASRRCCPPYRRRPCSSSTRPGPRRRRQPPPSRPRAST